MLRLIRSWQAGEPGRSAAPGGATHEAESARLSRRHAPRDRAGGVVAGDRWSGRSTDDSVAAVDVRPPDFLTPPTVMLDRRASGSLRAAVRPRPPLPRGLQGPTYRWSAVLYQHRSGRASRPPMSRVFPLGAETLCLKQAPGDPLRVTSPPGTGSIALRSMAGRLQRKLEHVRSHRTCPRLRGGRRAENDALQPLPSLLTQRRLTAPREVCRLGETVTNPRFSAASAIGRAVCGQSAMRGSATTIHAVVDGRGWPLAFTPPAGRDGDAQVAVRRPCTLEAAVSPPPP